MEQDKPAGPLKRYRLANSIPLSEMATALGVNKSTLGRIDRGLQWPSREFLERVSTFTKDAITPNDFLAIEPAPSEVRAA